MSRVRMFVVGAIVFAVLALVACGPAATPTPTPAPTPTPTQAPTPTSTPTPTQAPTAAPPKPANPDVILATTTSTNDTGLLDVLIPDFKALTGYNVKPVAVGSGAALAMGQRGEADVLLVHAPSSELALVQDGTVSDRLLVMHNSYAIVGPASDPAGIRGLTVAVDAMKKIANKPSVFVSRGDNSGTHQMEKSLWSKAGVTPSGSWYQEAGQGMGATLNIASEKSGYTLTDRGTYLALKKNLSLEALVQGDPVLLNIYHVMPVSQAKFPKTNAEGGKAFAAYIVSPRAQAIIKDFGVDKYGEPLFIPDAGKKDEEIGMVGGATPAPTVVPAATPTATPAPTPTPPKPANPDVILATTTSTNDTGLLDVLIPDFKARTGYNVKPIAVGSGAAIAMGERGEADVLLVHAPSLELPLVEKKVVTARLLVMHNSFAIVGPASDPAKIKGTAVAVDALKRIADSKSLFISRGDKSGTDTAEKALWTKIQVAPAGASWYQETGQGMSATLSIASEKSGYTYTDWGTWLATKAKLHLDVMVTGDPVFLNIYHVMPMNSALFPKVNAEGGKAFAEYMVSPRAQAIIKDFGVDKYGEPLFIPDAGKKDEDLSVASTPTPVGGYTIKVTVKGQAAGALTLADLKALEQKKVTIYGKEQNGPTLLSALKKAGISDFAKVTAIGLAKGRVGTTEYTLTKAQVSDQTVLDFTNSGTAKLASDNIPEERWVIDVNEFRVE